MTRRILLTALLAAASALTLLPAVTAAANVALGDSGELYVARVGTYGDLFPDEEVGIPAGRPVLAVDVFAEGEPMRRLLVPDSEGPDLERSPNLAFEPASQTLYVIWESQSEPTVSALYLSGLKAGEWTDPVEISGDIVPLKGAPQVEIATESYTAGYDEDGEPIARTRTLFHVVWWEEADATDEVYYAPVVLDNGVYLGRNPVIRLNSFAGPPVEGGEEASVPTALLRAPRLVPGRDVHASTIGFADADARRFLTLESRLLPAELGRMADGIRAQIIDIGHKGGPNGPPAKLCDAIRAQIIDIGRDFNPGVINHFSARAIEVLGDLEEEYPDLPDGAFGDKLRAHIIDIGARLLTDLGSRPASAKSRIVEIDPPPAGGGGQTPPAAGGPPPHLIEIRTVTRAPLPPVGAGPVQIFVSEDGQRSLVSWTHDDEVLYTESTTGGTSSWTEPKHLVTGDGFKTSDIAAILRSRVSQRP